MTSTLSHGLRRRLTAVVAVVSVVAAGLIVAETAPAYATGSGTVLFDQSFQNASLTAGDGAVALPATPSGTNPSNSACLTAGSGSTGPLPDCASAADGDGSGVLQLTNDTDTQEGGVFGATSVPTSQGLDLTFTTHQYGGTSADGIGFVLAAANPTDPVAPPNFGASGGALGYSPNGTYDGLADAYMGIGLDVYGNFSNSQYEGTGCSDPAYITSSGQVPGQVVVRGPGNVDAGYCALNSTATSTSSSPLALRDGSSRGSGVPVEVVINPTANAFTASTDSSVSVPAGDYAVIFTPVGGSQHVLQGALPTDTGGLGIPASWLGSDGIPKQLTFGWVASTGGSTDYHDIALVDVKSINPVAQFTATQTVSDAATASGGPTAVAQGGPVTYTVSAGSVSAGVSETEPVTVTDTLPTGVAPVSASGGGFVCGPPSGQTVSCTDSNTPFAAGATLPTMTVDGVVTTAGGLAESTIAGSTVTTASAADSAPGYTSTASPAPPDSAMTGLAISPVAGPAAGGEQVTMSGTNLAGATQVEIGTPAEIAAQGGAVLVPCSSDVSTGCFTVSNGDLTIASMPSHADGATQVVVTTQGTSASTSFTYEDPPDAPTPVSATAGDTTAAVSWTAGATNGTPVTAWTVTPYVGGVAQTAQAITTPNGTTTADFSGLSAGTTYRFEVIASSAAGTSQPGTSNQVSTNPAVAVTTSSLPAGEVGASYDQPLASSGGTGPYTWAVTAGSLPSGLSLDASTGVLSGRPTAAGPSSFTVQVIDADGETAVKALSLDVDADPTVTTTTLPAGEEGASYDQTLTASGGMVPYRWAVTAGSLPTGLSLDASTGVLSGTPTAAGPSSFTVQVTDADGETAVKALSLDVNADPAVTTTTLPAGEAGASYDQTLTASGGTGPYTWAVTAGSLPPGLSLDASTGVLSGTPTVSGPSSFTVQVTDAANQSATSPLTVEMAADPTVTTTSLPTGEANVSYDATLAASGGTGPYTWAATAGLPAGLSFDASTGVLSGTPTVSGPSSFTVQVTDADNQSATQVLSLDVDPDPTVTTVALPAGEVGVSWNGTVLAAGGTGAGTYRWAVSSGSLPAGMSLDNSTGVLSGTPTASGSPSFTVQVTDGDGQTATSALSIDVHPDPAIMTTSLRAGVVGAAYSQTVAGTGGTGAYTWSVDSGTLPVGLSLDSTTGAISGAPVSSGSSTFTVQVTDGDLQAAIEQYTLVVNLAPSVDITTASPLAAATVGTAYHQLLGAAGGTDPYSWSLTAGSSLPAGLSMSPAGTITGTPTAAETTTFGVKVTDSSKPALTTSGELSITVDPAPASVYIPVSPQRIADTRDGSGEPYAGRTLPAGATLTVAAGSRVPAGASAVTLSVTAVDATAPGFLIVDPTGSSTATSALDFQAGAAGCSTVDCVVPNLVVTPLSDAGTFTVTNGSGGTVDVVVDLEGYFTPATDVPGGRYFPLAPARLVDTRCQTDPGTRCEAEHVPAANAGLGALPAGGVATVAVDGHDDVPARGVAAAVVQLTATDTTTNGYLTAYPAGRSRPLASNANWVRGQTASARAIVAVGADGAIDVYNSEGRTDLVVDVVGYFTDEATATAGGQLFTPLVAPARLLDTRPGTSPGGSGPLGTGASMTLQVTGTAGVPAGATAAMVDVTEASATRSSYLSVTPVSTTAPATTSDVNFVPAMTQSNADLAMLSQGGSLSVYNYVGETNLTIDAYGYFSPAP